MMRPEVGGKSEVYCWGYNGGEVLFQGAQAAITTPRRLGANNARYEEVGVGVRLVVYGEGANLMLFASGGEDISRATDRGPGNVAVGYQTACYISAARTAACLGLGVIDRTPGTPLVPIQDLVFPSNSAIVVSDGAVWELSFLDSDDDVASPVSSTTGSPLAGVEQVEGATVDSVRIDRVCARRSNGTVACWGQVAAGELGQPEGLLVHAVEVPGLDDAIDVAVTSTASCAVRQAGTVVCWGSSDSTPYSGFDIYPSQPATTLLATPTAIGIVDAIDIEAGAYHFCAIRRSGQVICWGSNQYGQLGNGLTTEFATGFVPVTGMP